MIVLNTVTEPTEFVRLVQPQVAVFLENVSHGQGKLIISESAVTWIADNSTNGFALTYQSIILHAISRDLSSFPEECLYLLIDAKRSEMTLSPDQPQEPDSDGDEMEADEIQHVTLRFVPIDKSVLEPAYKQMCECQELNPASDMSDDECDYEEGEPVGDMPSYGDMGEGFQEGEGSGWYGQGTNPDEVELTPEGIANLQRMLGGGNIEQNGDHEMDG